jgi:rhamnosyltransferase
LIPTVCSPSPILPAPESEQKRPAKEDVCAIVVTYFPASDLLGHLRVIHIQVAKVLIVDNGSSGEAAKLLRSMQSELRVEVIHNGRNLGMAAALNQGIKWAEEHGYSWALTLDQDSLVAQDILESMSTVYEEFPNKQKLAVIGSNYIDSVLSKPFLNFNPDDSCPWQEVKTTITSGSLISLIAYRMIGPFRDELFIDGVDFEYCLRARSLGFRIIMARKPLMEHSIGAVTRHKLPWKMSSTSNHSPVRRYYMTRNQLLLTREYLWKEPAWAFLTLYRHLKDTILLCLFEKDITRKLRFTAMGALDGLLSNFKRNLAE